MIAGWAAERSSPAVRAPTRNGSGSRNDHRHAYELAKGPHSCRLSSPVIANLAQQGVAISMYRLPQSLALLRNDTVCISGGGLNLTHSFADIAAGAHTVGE
jgi:hypothetical protein